MDIKLTIKARMKQRHSSLQICEGVSRDNAIQHGENVGTSTG